MGTNDMRYFTIILNILLNNTLLDNLLISNHIQLSPRKWRCLLKAEDVSSVLTKELPN